MVQGKVRTGDRKSAAVSAPKGTSGTGKSSNPHRIHGNSTTGSVESIGIDGNHGPTKKIGKKVLKKKSGGGGPVSPIPDDGISK